MQVNNTFNTAAATQLQKSGNNLPPADAKKTQNTQEPPSIRDLAKTIDPSKMSRNDARAIATALWKTGELELDNAIALQSMILVNENGQLRNATETDSIMNEKFNMFDALKSQIEFNKSKGLATDYLEKGLDFLAKFKHLRDNPEVNLYA
jgi:hypothetical protein